MDNLTGKALAEYLLLHPEEANSECHWETLCLRDWVRIIKAHPELERFRPQLPAESPYTQLSMEEIIDLHREFMKDLKKFQKKIKLFARIKNSSVLLRQKPKQSPENRQKGNENEQMRYY